MTKILSEANDEIYTVRTFYKNGVSVGFPEVHQTQNIGLVRPLKFLGIIVDACLLKAHKENESLIKTNGQISKITAYQLSALKIIQKDLAKSDSVTMQEADYRTLNNALNEMNHVGRRRTFDVLFSGKPDIPPIFVQRVRSHRESEKSKPQISRERM